MDIFKTMINNELLSLNNRGKITYCYLICERLLPNYKYFNNIYEFGNPEILEKILILIHDYIVGDINLNKDVINSYIEEVEEITPDTNDFQTILASFALDACTSVISTLSFIIDNDYNNVLDVATYARDTVDMFIQERDNMDVNNRELENLIANDFLMLNEVQRQKNVINYLKEIGNIDEKILNKLKQMGSENIIHVSFFKE